MLLRSLVLLLLPLPVVSQMLLMGDYSDFSRLSWYVHATQ
jgi:hypothetical protein